MTKLLFDMYGVLMKPKSPSGHLRLIQAAGAVDHEAFQEIFEELRPAYDAGLVSDEHWWKQMGRRAGLGSVDVAKVVAADFEESLAADEEMVDYVRGLIGQGWTVGVLSNIPASLAQLVRAKHRWLEDFAAVTFSCDIGVAKPEAEAYAVAIDALGATAAETLFVDDRPDFIAAAGQAGLRTHQFDGIEGLRLVVEGLEPPKRG